MEKITAKIEHTKRLSQPDTKKLTFNEKASHTRHTSDHERAQRRLDFERIKSISRKIDF
jgi:hypothetical protein